MRGDMTASANSARRPRVEWFDIADDGESAAISGALGAEISAKFGPPETAPVSVRAYDHDRLVGGLNGFVHWRWLYVRHFWIEPDWRGRGLGRDVMNRVESEARARGCAGLYLDTFDPGAAAFYERCGFRRCGEIENFPPGHVRTFLAKAL